jgi:hypothetical protein
MHLSGFERFSNTCALAVFGGYSRRTPKADFSAGKSADPKARAVGKDILLF